MHELGLAHGIVAAVSEAAEAHQATKVKRITLRIGSLLAVNTDSLRYCLNILFEDTIMAGARVETRERAPGWYCSSCGWGTESDPGTPTCPHCQEAVQQWLGSEMCLEEMELDVESH